MYNNAPAAGYGGQPQQQEKNPNAGYLTKNQYGLFGQIPVTPELLAEIQRTGKVTISVSDPKQHMKDGDTWVSAYCGLKPYQPREQAACGYPQQAQAQPMYQQQASAPAQAPMQAPMQTPAQMPNGGQQPVDPSAGWNGQSDSIPF